MAELADQSLNVRGDDRLVLDDQDVGRQLGVDLGLSLGDQALDLFEGGVEDLGSLRGREPFQGSEQERLARARRDAHQAVGGVIRLRQGVFLGALELGAGRAPDGVEHVVERDAGSQPAVQRHFARRQGFKRNADVVVAGALVAGQGPRVAPDVRQMRRKPLKQAHHPSD